MGHSTKVLDSGLDYRSRPLCLLAAGDLMLTTQIAHGDYAKGRFSPKAWWTDMKDALKETWLDMKMVFTFSPHLSNHWIKDTVRRVPSLPELTSQYGPLDFRSAARFMVNHFEKPPIDHWGTLVSSGKRQGEDRGLAN